jgi:cytochrome c-type biogenesis protein CcmH/NrfF
VISQMDLWDMPIILVLLVGLLSAEWTYRRRRGLA